MSTASNIDGILKGFNSISLKEVQRASLMRRKDSKYMLSYLHVPSLLSVVENEYRVLEIEGMRSHKYQTGYYDTRDLEMYHMHHRGMANRHKVRYRKYGDSADFYLEVKKKDAKGVTNKNRIRTKNDQKSIMTKEEEFLANYSPYGHNNMIPVLKNSFNRITLVNHNQTERITLDYQLRFSSNLSEGSMEIPGLSIAEIKYEKHLSNSPFNAALRGLKITPRRFSKYAIGMAILNGDLKQNLFKQKIRKVHQINSTYLQIQKNP